MRWAVELTPPDGQPVRAAGMAGGICTARAHAAAAIAALARERTHCAEPLDITVVTGRRTITVTVPPAALRDLQILVTILRDVHTLTRDECKR